MIDTLDLSVVILCPERNISGVKCTAYAVQRYFSEGLEMICITGNNATASEIKEMKVFCPTYKGKDTITSLINTGINKIKGKWALLMYAGSSVRPFVERKLRYFAESPKDVLYPVVGMKMNFVEGSSNGILINKETFKEVGEFPEHKMQKAGVNDFELAKLFWATKAIECGCKFKGIVGLRII